MGPWEAVLIFIFASSSAERRGVAEGFPFIYSLKKFARAFTQSLAVQKCFDFRMLLSVEARLHKSAFALQACTHLPWRRWYVLCVVVFLILLLTHRKAAFYFGKKQLGTETFSPASGWKWLGGAAVPWLGHAHLDLTPLPAQLPSYTREGEVLGQVHRLTTSHIGHKMGTTCSFNKKKGVLMLSKLHTVLEKQRVPPTPLPPGQPHFLF